MIDVISGKDLLRLVEFRDGYCVSLYLPTHRMGGETAQDPIRFKNALTRTRTELKKLGVRPAEVDRLLAPAAELENNRTFWAHVDMGLGVFIGRDGTSVYRLPATVEELVVVADRFHLKPLLPAVTTGEVFYVLVISINTVRLLSGSRFSVTELALRDIPASLAEALWFDDREAQLQSHAAGRIGTGDVTATFHGQGAAKDTREVDLHQFLAAVDAGVRQIVADTDAPIVLAGVADTVAHYRHLSRYPRLVEEAIQGSVERLTPAELHEQAWPLVEPLFKESEGNARDALLNQLNRSVGNLPEALAAARQGRVAALFVPLGTHCWGSFDADEHSIEVHDERLPGDRDLFDVAAIETLAHRGDVFVVDRTGVPGDGPVAALLRF